MINANLDAESNLPNKNSRGEVNEQMNIINLYKERHTITDCRIFCPEKSNLNKFDFRDNWQQKFRAIPGKIRRKKWFGCSLARSFRSSLICFQMPIEEKQKDCWKGLRTEPKTIGINSIAAMMERELTHVTLVALPNWLRRTRAPTNTLVHRTLADKARKDILRFVTARYRPTKAPTSHRLVGIHCSLADQWRFLVGRQNVG